MNMIKHSPYHHKFVALGATFVDRLGFSAPLVFTSTEEEHLATRNGVGLFDVYYQVAIAITGQDAQSFVDFGILLIFSLSLLGIYRVKPFTAQQNKNAFSKIDLEPSNATAQSTKIDWLY